MTEFQKFPKIALLFQDIVITEQIDGINGAIGIDDDGLLANWASGTVLGDGVVSNEGHAMYVYAQSRNRIVTPTMDDHGFARWVWDNAASLVADLGPGLHFGEWWGSGINRGYGLPEGEKRFSLFNTERWTEPCPIQHCDSQCGLPKQFKTPGLGVVPVIWRGTFSTDAVEGTLQWLEDYGSQAAPGFMNPEGVVVYHTAGDVMFKAIIKNDKAWVRNGVSVLS
ncbi:MAG TPA: RNA ligase family protein [Polyangiaceae bacterium]